jgi:hypothetical protein
MTRKRLLTFCAAAAIAAGALATSALALQGGAPDGDQHPYVGAMVQQTAQGNELCSGVLVAPQVFVTAAHCILGPGPILVSTAPQFAGPQTIGFGHPDPAWTPKAGGLSSSDLNDVAVVTLLSPLPGPYARLPQVGFDDSLPNNQLIDNVGYGVPYPGLRQVVTQKIVPGGGVTGPNFLKLAAGTTCNGDSGGPNLLAGTDLVLAINSYGPSASCNAVSYSQRLDTQQVHDFIAGFLN